jgi:hypothetical protein
VGARSVLHLTRPMNFIDGKGESFMIGHFKYFNGRVNTTINFYPIVIVNKRNTVALRWRYIDENKIEVLESKCGSKSQSRMTELEKLEGEFISSKQFILEGE